MSKSNFERMMELAESVFDYKNDPGQLLVNENVIERLKKLHPSTLSEYIEGNGPVSWVLLIPTTSYLMNEFLQNEITERELFEKTPINVKYDALYLCSALVLDEYRRKGIVKKLVLDAIKKISEEHPLKFLFVWPFSEEGKLAAEKIAEITTLPLFIKPL